MPGGYSIAISSMCLPTSRPSCGTGYRPEVDLREMTFDGLRINRSKYHPTLRARAMRSLEQGVYSVVHMALVASLSLDEPLAVQNAEKLSLEEFRFIVPRLLIEKQN